MKPNFFELENGLIINLDKVLYFSKKEVTFENHYITIDSETYSKIINEINSIV